MMTVVLVLFTALLGAGALAGAAACLSAQRSISSRATSAIRPDASE